MATARGQRPAAAEAPGRAEGSPAAIGARICAGTRQQPPATPRAGSTMAADAHQLWKEHGARGRCARVTPSSPFYDGMILRLIVHGDTREQALARLDDALAQTHIVGLAITMPVPAPRGERFFSAGPARYRADPARGGRAVSAREGGACRWPPPRRRGQPAAARAGRAGRRSLQPPRRLALADPVPAPLQFELQKRPARRGLADLRAGRRLRPGGWARGEAAVHGPLAFAPAAGGSMDLQITQTQRRTGCSPCQGETGHIFTPRGTTRIRGALDLLAHAGRSASEGGRPQAAPMPGKGGVVRRQAGDKVAKARPWR